MTMWMWVAVALVTGCGAGVIAVAVWLRREMPDVVTRPRLLLGTGTVVAALAGLAVVTAAQVAA